MSPLLMSHINRTRPRQGLQLVIRRVAGSQISHIFRRAGAGSEVLPSLARRVSMQQHAELPCRGNSLRKTAINDAIRNGATMHEVREFAGHADIRTTEVYFVRKEEDAEVAARRIQIRLTGSGSR